MEVRQPEPEPSLLQKCWWKWCAFFFFAIINHFPEWLGMFMFGWVGQEKYVDFHPADAFLAHQLCGIEAIIALLLGIIFFFFYGILWAFMALLGFLLLTPLFVRVTLQAYLNTLLFFARRAQNKKMAQDQKLS